MSSVQTVCVIDVISMCQWCNQYVPVQSVCRGFNIIMILIKIPKFESKKDFKSKSMDPVSDPEDNESSNDVRTTLFSSSCVHYDRCRY